MASYIIKLGGGLITDKSVPRYVRQDVLEQAAHELAEMYKKHPSATWLIGNGAGSFGHYTVQAVRYKDVPADPEKIKAVRQSVIDLNVLVVTALRASGIPAKGLAPHTFMKEINGRIEFDHRAIAETYAEGEVPVVYGDVITVDDDSSRIAPTEEVLETIGHWQLEQTGQKATACVYASSVQGVLDSKGATIPVLRQGDSLHEHKNDRDYDVTGGMAQKVAAGFEALGYAENVYIVNGAAKGHIAQALGLGRIDTRLEA